MTTRYGWIAAVAAYIKETGDYGILDVQVPFDCKKGTEVPLFEHLEKSFYYTVTHLGPHKLPLIGRADWNDLPESELFFQ